MYIAKAFVRILNKKNRESTLVLLRKGRMQLQGNSRTLDSDYLFFTKNKFAIMQKHDVKSQSKKAIDCNFYANGDEEKAIELFLELATLTDDLQTTTYLRCIRSVPPYYHYGDIVKRDAVEILNNFEICQPISLATAFKNEKN